MEIEVAKELRGYAAKVGGREQLAEAFANAVEIIPRTLAENAGLEPIDVIVEVRVAHEKPDGQYMDVNVFSGKVENMNAKGIVEPVVVKEQAIKSPAESASMILRIDDVIASSKPKETPKMSSEGGGGEEY